MDGVFTTCRSTPECTRLSDHDGACNIPVKVMRRTPSSRLRYLADEIEKEWSVNRQLAVSSALRDLAQELE